jgi:hypothetical protein
MKGQISSGPPPDSQNDAATTAEAGSLTLSADPAQALSALRRIGCRIEGGEELSPPGRE